MSNKVKQCGIKDYDLSTFTWDICTNCQYRCSYCYAHDILTKNFIEKYRYVYKKILKRLSLNKIGNFRIELVGGEPMLHPDIYEIINKLQDLKNCVFISINTNLVKDIKEYEKFNIDKFKNLEFSASFHPQYNKKIDNFLNKIKLINEFENTNICVNINIVEKNEYLPLYKKLYNFCLLNDIDVAPNFIFSTDKFKSNFSKDFLNKFDYLKEYETDFIPFEFTNGDKKLLDYHKIYQNDLTNFKGYNCIPKMWSIKVDGSIVNCCTGEFLSITNKNYKKCVSCPKDLCPCEELYKYHKTEPGELLPKK